MPNTNNDKRKRERLLQERKQIEHRRDYKDPIKHYVRKHGWVPAAINRLRKLESNRTLLTYFSLCAKYAIDIRWFYLEENLIRFDGLGFPDVVFCEDSPDQYGEITRRLGRTIGYRARFEDLILDRESDDSRDFYDRFPFDVYNLDFSGQCFPESEPPYSKTLRSIVTLIEELARLDPHTGFDIFFTFQASRSKENEEAINDLRRNLRDNRHEYSEFNDLIENKYGENIRGLKDRYHEFLLICLPKYLGRVANDNGFQVGLTHRFHYPRPSPRNIRYHIISFGLSFDWIGFNNSLHATVRQPVPKHEVRTSAYLDMMIELVSSDIQNVASTSFPKDEYAQEVQSMLEAFENG